MSNAEQEVLNEIEEYYKQISQTKSYQRKSQLYRHINKLKKELLTFRQFRYNN